MFRVHWTFIEFPLRLLLFDTIMWDLLNLVFLLELVSSLLWIWLTPPEISLSQKRTSCGLPKTHQCYWKKWSIDILSIPDVIQPSLSQYVTTTLKHTVSGLALKYSPIYWFFKHESKKHQLPLRCRCKTCCQIFFFIIIPVQNQFMWLTATFLCHWRACMVAPQTWETSCLHPYESCIGILVVSSENVGFIYYYNVFWQQCSRGVTLGNVFYLSVYLTMLFSTKKDSWKYPEKLTTWLRPATLGKIGNEYSSLSLFSCIDEQLTFRTLS